MGKVFKLKQPDGLSSFKPILHQEFNIVHRLLRSFASRNDTLFEFFE